MRVAGPARRTASAFAAVLAALAFAIALPFLLSGNYQLGIAHQVLIFMILAVGYDVLLGFTGLLSFGHIGLFAIGAYTSALLVMSAGAPFLVGLVGAALLTGVIGFLIAIPALRIKGHYLTLLTLALGEVIRLVLRSMESVTHGSSGLSGIPRPEILDSRSDRPRRSTTSCCSLRCWSSPSPGG